MSYWNYRVLAKKLDSEIEFGLYEVYYDDDNNPISCTENACFPLAYDECGDYIKSLKWTLNKMKIALKKPILDYDNFPNEYKTT